MSFELQIKSSVLGAITANAVQARLRAVCFAPLDSSYVDHVDVATSPMTVFETNASLRLNVPLSVFIVQKKDVLAAPNSIPAGATTPVGTVRMVLEMSVAGSVVLLKCVDAELGTLGIVPGLTAMAVKTALIQGVGAPFAADLTSVFKKLGLPAPNSSRIELSNDTVAIRFNRAGKGSCDLFSGQDWGFFMDRASVEELANIKVPDNFQSRLTLLASNVLPTISLGGAWLGQGKVLASTEGIAISGLVQLPTDSTKTTLHASVKSFSQPYRLEPCSILAQCGSSVANVTLAEVATNGSVWLENSGAFCDIEFISPGSGIAPYVQRPAAKPEIKIAIPSSVARGINHPVRLIVRTARGVRLVDLGTPPRVMIDAHGSVTNAMVNFIGDCPSTPDGPEDAYGIDWGSSDEVTVPVSEHPDWATYLERQHGIDIQLVTLTALEPGELIQFRSGDHAVDITADHRGRAIVPVLLPIADRSQRASLIRVNRRRIAGHFTIRTAMLINHINLPVGMKHRMHCSTDASAFTTTQLENHIELYEVGPERLPVAMRRNTISAFQKRRWLGNDEADDTSVSTSLMGKADYDLNFRLEALRDAAELNPLSLLQRTTGRVGRDSKFSWRHTISGIKSLVAVPGFAEVPIGFAIMEDGSTLILELGENGATRLAGTFAGPIGALEISGNWAPIADTERLSVYRVAKNQEHEESQRPLPHLA